MQQQWLLWLANNNRYSARAQADYTRLGLEQ